MNVISSDIFGQEQSSSAVPVLVLGVADIPYDTGETTGDVAEILEGKYHVMEIFAQERADQIQALLTDTAADTLADLFAGRRPNGNPLYDATQKIEEMFRDFLDADEISAIMPLTQQITAAQIGKNSRKKSGYNKGNEGRPAFIDSGLYQSSFRAWVEA